MDVDRKRVNCIAKQKLGWRIIDICKSEQIGRATFYRWLNDYNRNGYKGLVKKSTRPKTIHCKMTEDVVEMIIRLRKETGSNEHAISSVLRQRGIEAGHTTVYKVLRENGLINCLSGIRKQKTYIRYEREHPNSLWQGDLTNWEESVVIAYIDDHSRFVTGYGLFDNGLSIHVMDVLRQAIGSYGKPRQVITDHGTQFYNVHGGESEFDRFCTEQGIEHILGSIGKPTTTGKIERWFGTFKAQIDSFRSVGDYVKYYNYERPHKSLGFTTPAERYFVKNVS